MTEFCEKLTNTAHAGHMLDGAVGVTVALSGGADSVALLLALKKSFVGEIKAVHINHNIRQSALRDENFCRALCEKEKIPLAVYSENVPAYAAEKKLGIEEAAREVRYRIFDSLCKDDFPVALAHTADDNLETVIFNLCRGASLRGLAGIVPSRGGIIRPMIEITREEILEFLASENTSFVTDETNFDTAYTRNFIRHKIVPLLRDINPSVAPVVSSSSALLRRDEKYLVDTAKKYLGVETAVLSALDDAILSRVIQCLYREKTGKSLPSYHTAEIMRLIRLGNKARVSLPAGCYADISEHLSVRFPENKPNEPLYSELFDRINLFSINGKNALAYIGNDPPEKSDYINIYNLFITDKIVFDRIYGKVFVRERMPGDTIRSGGMTKKLKKLFCDRLTPEIRKVTPVFCDDNGVFFVPGVCIRDDVKYRGDGKPCFICFFAQI